MPPTAVATPTLITDAGYLFIAPLATAVPANTVAGSIFTDAWPVGFLPLGATQDGSTFSYTTNVEAIQVAEFYDPIKYATTSRNGSMAFNLANFSLSNYRRALNGGTAALTATSGTGATSLFTIAPAAVGGEVRCMIGWESLDNTVRLICYQTIQGGEIASSFKKAPDYAVIPCTFNLEVPASGTPFNMYSAGVARG
jgi:hypothetical protein